MSKFKEGDFIHCFHPDSNESGTIKEVTKDGYMITWGGNVRDEKGELVWKEEDEPKFILASDLDFLEAHKIK